MKKAEDFRSIARDTLAGKWKNAVLVGLVASILGAVDAVSLDLNIDIDAGNAKASLELAGQPIFTTGGTLNSDIGAFLAGGAIYLMIVAIIMWIALFVLGSIIGVGYRKYNLNLVDRQEAGFDNLFAYFLYWKNAFKTKLLKTIYEILWTMLFIIPGIIASYSYAMTDYILAENPELTAKEAIEKSKDMMEGNRWRLFCLEISFIGWRILSVLTLGIGGLWLVPYMEASVAAFYREISGTEKCCGEEEWLEIVDLE